MKENIFVFRIAKGNEHGNPQGRCPLDYSQTIKRISNLKTSDMQIIDYDKIDYIQYLHKELWNNNILRQGWGVQRFRFKSRYTLLDKKLYVKWKNILGC